MKCTNCGIETDNLEINEETRKNIVKGDDHCRLMLFNKVKSLISLKSLGELKLAKKLVVNTNFIDNSTNVWKNSLEKNIDDLLLEAEKIELGRILIKIERGEALSEDEILILEKNNKFNELADYYLKLYEINDDLWKLSQACKFFRKAKNPTAVIKITESIDSNSTNLKALTAVLTSRGGAFRDLEELDKAKKCALNAINISETYHPHQLLGAIYMEEEEFEKAKEHFNKAIKLGATPEINNNVIQGVVGKLSEDANKKWMEIYFRK